MTIWKICIKPKNWMKYYINACAGPVYKIELFYCTGSISGFSDGQSPGREVQSEHKRSKANDCTEREENPRGSRSQLTI